MLTILVKNISFLKIHISQSLLFLIDHYNLQFIYIYIYGYQVLLAGEDNGHKDAVYFADQSVWMPQLRS